MNDLFAQLREQLTHIPSTDLFMQILKTIGRMDEDDREVAYMYAVSHFEAAHWPKLMRPQSKESIPADLGVYTSSHYNRPEHGLSLGYEGLSICLPDMSSAWPALTNTRPATELRVWYNPVKNSFTQEDLDVLVALFYWETNRGNMLTSFGALGQSVEATVHAKVAVLPYRRRYRIEDFPLGVQALVIYEGGGGHVDEADDNAPVTNLANFAMPGLKYFATNVQRLRDSVGFLKLPRVITTFEPDTTICKVKGDLTVMPALNVEEMCSLGYQYVMSGQDQLQDKEEP